MDSLTTKIVDRLERYTDHDHDAAREIARQVSIALGIDESLSPVVMSENNYENELERENTRGFQNGHRVGYMKAMDDICAADVLANDTVLHTECGYLRSGYLDNH